MTDFYVDVDALSELARQLRVIKSGLENAKDDVESRMEGLGSKDIQHTLDDFVNGWRDGRKEIIKGIDGLTDRIQNAIDTYNETEQQIASSANQSNSH